MRISRSTVTAPRLPAIYFEKLLEDSPDIVVAVDRHGVIIVLQRRRAPDARVCPDGRAGPARDAPLSRPRRGPQGDGGDARHGRRRPGRIRNFETDLRRRSAASALPVAISGSIIRTPRGEELGSIGFAKDLREIRRHDQLATLGEVAIGVAHEINNPLEVIVNNLNLLEAYVERVSSDEDFIVESERLDSTHGGRRPHPADRRRR